ncbi:SDR family oxidoreductase [Rhodothermus marinus]|uniref:NAD-dependent epimerase/dehydratase n=1 Tax=Rhodothermus marinus (strain ATCC 43812 / DSM 4252 / R-10) TaxID=518766 RepID=D0MJ34_RHOM4|nr:SDR family oxidoreductase [Rhodothermus marinus]ACY48492.1 NAD-dependent epimerase/dehydratase [Rhodothermus marinus DSM 4252]
MPEMRVLVTGATGYVGGRLIPRLLEAGYPVRAMARDRRRLEGRPWSDRIEIVEADVLRPETLPDAVNGIHTVFYLIHALGGGDDFMQKEQAGARHLAEAAARAGVSHIIYLGGLQPPRPVSRHLESRRLTGEALRSGPVPVTELRAGIILGSGSLSFELIRYLTERLPVMITPRWVKIPTQPIAIRNVLDYLMAALQRPPERSRIVDIGGPDVLTYADLFRLYARLRGLRRWIVPVPALTPRLSSYWIGLVTPLPARIARKLIDSLKAPTVCRDDLARRLFPEVTPLSAEAAMRLALQRLDAGHVETIWFGAYSSGDEERLTTHLEDREGLLRDTYSIWIAAAPSAVFAYLKRLGGARGWPYANGLWRLRGVLDRLVGGIGYRRGRRHPEELYAGDAVDFWRVEALEPERRLLLRAEMKVPGRAWLQFVVQPEGKGTRLIQQALFEPRGLAGLLYWYSIYPLHRFVFRGMLRAIKQQVETSR